MQPFARSHGGEQDGWPTVVRAIRPSERDCAGRPATGGHERGRDEFSRRPNARALPHQTQGHGRWSPSMILRDQGSAVHALVAPTGDGKQDARRDRFAKIPYSVLFDRTLSRDARLLYAVLVTHWWKHGECFASHATLAEELGVKERMLRNYLSELLRAGHIVKRPRGRGRAVAFSPA